MLDLQCFKKTCSNKFKQEKVRIEQERELEQDKKEVLEVKESNVLKGKEIEKEMTEEEKWESEYRIQSRVSKFMETLEKLKTCIYTFGGYLSYNRSDGQFEMS
ncbi:MAG: hypothetical protein WCK88_06420 [bacterium]